MSYVWPRLASAFARPLLEEAKTIDVTTLRRTSGITHPDAAPIAVGGQPAPEALIVHVQASVRALSDSLGFPAELPRSAVSTFDQPATRLLHKEMDIVPADAASEEVWNFISLVILPDVAAWRFPGRADDRLLGRPRNVFRRLWWRGESIGPDVIDVPNGLGEDELVNIMERATIAANPLVARAIATTVFENTGLVPGARSELMRDVAKRLLRTQVIICIDALPEGEIRSVVERCFSEAAVSLATSQSAGKGNGGDAES